MRVFRWASSVDEREGPVLIVPSIRKGTIECNVEVMNHDHWPGVVDPLTQLSGKE
jgi:hypothetical protein